MGTMEIRVNAPEVEHDTIIQQVVQSIGDVDDCESVGDELIICYNHQNDWTNLTLSQPLKITLFDDDTNIMATLNLLGSVNAEPTPTEPAMSYGAFLIFNLICDTIIYGDMVKDAPHDEQFSLSLAIYQDFLDSIYNTDDKSEYDCITEYIRRVDVIHIIDQHIK